MKFIHSYASERRRRRNRIRRLVKDDGVLVEEERKIQALITNFYKDLFRSRASGRYDEMLTQVHPKVSPEMNEFLLRDFCNEEIKSALIVWLI